MNKSTFKLTNVLVLATAAIIVSFSAVSCSLNVKETPPAEVTENPIKIYICEEGEKK